MAQTTLDPGALGKRDKKPVPSISATPRIGSGGLAAPADQRGAADDGLKVLLDTVLGPLGLGPTNRERTRRESSGPRPGPSFLDPRLQQAAVYDALSVLPVGAALRGRPLQAASPDLVPGFAKTAEQKVTERAVKTAPETQAAPLLREAEEEFIGQRRGVRSHEETLRAAEVIRNAGLNTDEVVRLGQSGTAVNAEQLVAANSVADDAAEQFVKAVDSSTGDPFAALVDALKVQKAVRGFIAEGGRVTEANKLIKDELAERVAKDTSTARQAIEAARGLENPDNLRMVVSLAKGLDFKSKDEVRRLFQTILEMGEVEAKAKIKPPTAGDQVISALNIPRTIMASFDLSAPLRQGAVLSVSHPGIAARATGVMLKSLADEQFAKNVMAEILSAPTAPLRKQAGLYFADFQGQLTAREEAFMSTFADKIPGISASNRAYAMYLNKLRADVFDQVVGAWGTGKKPGEYQALASFINWATGRGDIGFLNRHAPLLNAAFFSPRLIVSRVQTPLAPILFAAQGNFAAAKFAAGDLTKFVGAGLAMLALAKMGGASVEDDPRSSKFGKIEIGPHQIDIWAGFQPVARYMTQFITGERKTAKGEIVVTDGSGPFGEDRLGTIGKFVRSKLSPQASLGVDALAGSTFIGDPFDPASAAAERLIPLAAQQLYEAVEADRKDAIRGAIAGSLGLIGLGVVSIDDETGQPLFFGERTPVNIEKARLNVEAPVIEGYSLTADQQRRYQSLVEDSRHNALGALLQDPGYLVLPVSKQREEWEKVDRKGADAGRKAYGIELAATGKNQDEILTGIRLAVNNTPGNYEKAVALSVINSEGVVTGEIEARYNASLKPNDLTIAQYIHGKELVEGWKSSPSFTVGTPEVWAVTKRARDQFVEMTKDMTADERKKNRAVQDFYKTAAGGWLRTLYEQDGSRNEKYIHPTRKMIAKDKNWDRFSAAVRDLP